MELNFLLAVLDDGTYRGDKPVGIDDVYTQPRDTVVLALQRDLKAARDHVIAATFAVSRASKRVSVSEHVLHLQSKLAKTVVIMSSQRSQHKSEVATLKLEIERLKRNGTVARRRKRKNTAVVIPDETVTKKKKQKKKKKKVPVPTLVSK